MLSVKNPFKNPFKKNTKFLLIKLNNKTIICFSLTKSLDLTPPGTANYGYMLRDQHAGINVTTFEAIEEKAA